MTTSALNPTLDSPSELRSQVLALRAALAQMCAAAAKAYTTKGIKAHRAAHAAHVASFSSEERALVVAHVHATRGTDLDNFFEVIDAYGTSVISELQSDGRIA